MRLFPGKLPNISRRRSSMALLVGTAVAIALLGLGKEWHPPAYPVKPLMALTTTLRHDIMWAATGTLVPETIEVASVPHLVGEDVREFWIDGLNLDPTETEILSAKYAHKLLDPLVPALYALHQRTTITGAEPNAFQESIQNYLNVYPQPMDSPNCSLEDASDFDRFVCQNFVATLRHSARATYFRLWFDKERNRHQFGQLFDWARVRAQQPRRTALLVHESTAPLPDTSVDELTKTILGSEIHSVAIRSVSSFTTETSLTEAIQTQLRPNAPFLEDWMYPRLTMSCGTLASTAHIQVVPLVSNDPDIDTLCLHELARRQAAEVEVQEVYSEIIQLRDTALHNKNILQFSAWLHQRRILSRLNALLDRVVVLERDALPEHTLWQLSSENMPHWATAASTLTTHLGSAQADTLLAFVSQPAPHTAQTTLRVTRTQSTRNTARWLLIQQTQPAGYVYSQGNVFYLDAQAAETLGFIQDQDAPSELWTTCLNAARLEQPTSWCTGHQWMTLSYQTAHPGRLHQIVHHSASDRDEYLVPAIPTGWMLFWGSSLNPETETEAPWVSGTGSAGITLFEHLTRQPVDPTEGAWPYRSVLLDLR